MMRLVLSPAAAALLRALLDRAKVRRDRILLSDFTSVDWQSLTLVGERHVICLRVPGPDAQSVVQALTDDLGEAEFSIPAQIVADIALASPPETAADGSISIRMEALTIAD